MQSCCESGQKESYFAVTYTRDGSLGATYRQSTKLCDTFTDVQYLLLLFHPFLVLRFPLITPPSQWGPPFNCIRRSPEHPLAILRQLLAHIPR